MNGAVLIPFVAGLIFGTGLIVGGMTDPANVIGFLDIFHDWRPDLMLVMLGAVVVHGISYRFIMRHSRPRQMSHLQFLSLARVDFRLVFGSCMFGAGWGMSGFCPGPAITALPSQSRDVFFFVFAMILGIVLYQKASAIYLRGQSS